MNQQERVALQENILLDLKLITHKNVSILDVGCGNGGVVKEYRDKYYDAHGCDFAFKEGVNVDNLKAKGYIKIIDKNKYRLPFNDDQFDLVVSDQVLEHVADYTSTLKEINRVLKPGGASLHIFPSRYMPIEPHVFVPLATVIQKRWWLYLWATMGIRSEKQQGLGAKDVANNNYDYLVNCTNYLTKSQVLKYIDKYFCNVIFCEKHFLKHSRKGKILFSLSKFLPFIPRLYSAFRLRVIVFHKASD